jgi:glucokinase
VTVGLDIRPNSILAVQVTADGQVTSRAVKAGGAAVAVADTVRAFLTRAPKRIGAAVAGTGDDSARKMVDAAIGAAHAAAATVVTTGAGIALAEQWVGAARGANHVAVLAIDDHVHGGIVANGRLFDGAHGFAGAAAWLALNPVERDDYRRLGCLQAEISAEGIARRLVWRVKTGDPSQAQELAGGELADVTATQVLDAARAGDGVALAVVRDTARYIGMAIANLVAIVDPEVVVLGGLIADAGDLLIEPARAEAARRIAATSTPRIVTAALGGDGPAIGAARAAMLKE